MHDSKQNVLHSQQQDAPSGLESNMMHYSTCENWSKGKDLIVAVKGQRHECYAESNRDGG